MGAKKELSIEEQIRICCERGMGKQPTWRTLGLTRYQFELYTSVMPDLVWPAKGHTLEERQGTARTKGYYPPAKREALDKARAAREEMYKVFSICGVRGNLKELHALWAGHTSVSLSQTRRRLNEGWSLYDAMFMKRRPSCIDWKQGERKRRMRSQGNPAWL